MSARIVMWGFVVATLALHGVVAWLAPIASDDWDFLVWASQHRRDGTGDWLAAFFAKHYTLADVTNYTVARYPIAHAIVMPLCALAVVWGTFAMATRRLPRFDAWADVAGVVVIAALLWIGAPRCGLTYFHRPYAATWLCGTAVTLWFLVPLRCGWRPRGAQIALVVIAGLLAGTSTRQFGMLATAVIGYAIAKTPKPQRTTWMWLALAAVAFGTALGFYRALFDFRGIRPGFELSLVALNLPIFEGGELVSLVGGLVLTKIVVGTLWPVHAGERAPETTETLRWFGVWLAYIIIALLGPRYSEAALYPAAVLLCIAVFPVVRWVMTSKPLRLAVLAIAIGINVVAWSMALSTYVPIAGQFRERVATLKAAPKNTVATVKTYTQIRPGFWAYGEDWNDAARRQYIATALYRLTDIALSPAFRRLEYNPKLDLRLVVEGVTLEQLREAGAPEKWASTLRTARVQFEEVLKNLNVSTPFSMRLVVDRLPLDVLRGRELVAATYDRGITTTLKIQRRVPDDESKQGIMVRPTSFAAAHPEAYAVIGGRATPVAFARKRYMVQALTTELHAIVACDQARCFLVDAFIPSL